MLKIQIFRGSARTPLGGAYWESLHCFPRGPELLAGASSPITPLHSRSTGLSV